MFLVNVVFVKLAIRWVGGRVVLLNIRNGLVKPFNTEAVYHEESGYLAYFGGSFHADGLTRKVPGNILFDHQREHHPRKELTLKDFRMKVIGTIERPILRLSREGVMIANQLKIKEEKGA